MTAEDATFRGAMRLLAGGVTIVASAHEGQRGGMTATAVCSLALAPPRILVSINIAGHTYEIVSRSRCMSVNLLAHDHENLAARFAARRAAEGDDRLAHGEWRTLVTGAPVLADALAGLDCRVTEIIPLDTHAILIGTVEEVLFGPRRAPLIHFEAGYTTLMPRLPESAS